MSDPYDRYLDGMRQVLKALESDSENYLTMLTLQDRLVRSVADIRGYDSPEAKAELSKVTTEVNRICLARLKTSFNAICRIGERPEEVSVAEAFLTPDLVQKYLERLRAELLGAFRHDYYVMLSVEPLESEDPLTLFALQEALRSTFDTEVTLPPPGPDRREPLEQAIASERLVALLGVSGIGKTYSLRAVALEQIRQVQNGTVQSLPVWASLGRWEDKSQSAEEFLCREFNRLLENKIGLDQFIKAIHSGAFVVLLDGLNELPQRDLSTPKESIAMLDTKMGSSETRISDPRENSLMVLGGASQSRFIVSCRVLEYTRLPGWQEFHVLPLGDLQIEDLAARYLEARSSRLTEILEQQPPLKDLVRTPFFLFCLIVLVQMDWAEVPTDRFEVVKYFCQAALRRAAARQSFDVAQVVGALGREALASMSEGYIGSSLSILVEKQSDEGDGNSAELPLLDMMRRAEASGLITRTKTIEGAIGYRFHHQLVQEALALLFLETVDYRERSHPSSESLNRLGEIHLQWGKRKEAQENLQRALELCPALGADAIRSTIYLNLSRVHRIWRQSRLALHYATAAVELLGRLPNAERSAETYHELGLVNERLRKHKQAEYWYQRSVETYKGLGDHSKYAYEIIYGLGDFYGSPQVYRIQTAIHWYEIALEAFKALEDVEGTARTKLQIAHARRLWGEMEEAVQLFRDAAADFEHLELPAQEMEALEFWGYMLRDSGLYSQAEPIVERAFQLAVKSHSTRYQFDILIYGLAWVAILLGNPRRAFALLDEGLKLAHRQADPYFLAQIHSMGFGYVAWWARDFSKAASAFLISQKNMDEEYRLHINVIERLGITWARLIGANVARSRFARWGSEVLWQLTRLYERWHYPTSQLGRYLYRFGWWLHRF